MVQRLVALLETILQTPNYCLVRSQSVKRDHKIKSLTINQCEFLVPVHALTHQLAMHPLLITTLISCVVPDDFTSQSRSTASEWFIFKAMKQKGFYLLLIVK